MAIRLVSYMFSSRTSKSRRPLSDTPWTSACSSEKLCHRQNIHYQMSLYQLLLKFPKVLFYETVNIDTLDDSHDPKRSVEGIVANNFSYESQMSGTPLNSYLNGNGWTRQA